MGKEGLVVNSNGLGISIAGSIDCYDRQFAVVAVHLRAVLVAPFLRLGSAC